jgi:hypothetical protein
VAIGRGMDVPLWVLGVLVTLLSVRLVFVWAFKFAFKLIFTLELILDFILAVIFCS